MSFSVGDKVKTILTDKISDDWLPEALPKRKFGVLGVIVAEHNSHGECYEVQHDDGTIGSYDPWELMKVLSRNRRADGVLELHCQPPEPTTEQVEIAKKEAAKNVKEKNLLGTCCVCLSMTAVPSDVKSIMEFGVCFFCKHYLEDKSEWVIRREMPTLNDVLAQWKLREDLSQMEQKILMGHYEHLKSILSQKF